MRNKGNGTKGKKSLLAVIAIIFAFSLVPVSTQVGLASEVKPPIKIGILYPLTGPLAGLGKRSLRGWEVALEATNYKVADRPIQVTVEDTEGNPSIGLTKTTKLIERDQVHVLGGVVSSAVAYAIRDTVERNKIPLIITLAGAAGITQEKRSPYVFRLIQPSSSGPYYMAQYLYEDLKLRRAVTSYNDYFHGHESAKAFKKEFERLGGQVLFETFPPMGTPDYGPYTTKLGDFAGKADVVFFVHNGAEGIRFVKAAVESGLKKKFVLANWGSTEDGIELQQLGASAEGIYTISSYFLNIKTDANQRFLELDKKKGGHLDIRDFYGYLGAEVVLRALNQIKGNVEAKDDFLKALREVRFESASGPTRFDPRSQGVLQNVYIAQARRVSAQIQNVILKTIPEAQDPWWIGK